MDTQIDKAVWNGGGRKRVSENQTNLIEDLANERDIDLNVMVQSRYGKHHSELNGAQANELIRSLLDL